MNTTQTPQHTKTGFDNEKYISLQSKAILERIEKFSNGRLYLEVGGKLINDSHAERVLPGFKKENKVTIFKNLGIPFDILFCLDYEDILSNRQLTNRSHDYVPMDLEIIKSIEREFGIKPKIVINKIKDEKNPLLLDAIDALKTNSYEVYQRYFIDGYPDKADIILSNSGYGRDKYIPIQKPLVIVTGASSESGKMSTCLGQIYLESSRYNINSGYAKYETFPIWNLDLNHPVNLAYEAATADIGGRNVIDLSHLETYGVKSVCYNRDSQSFKIMKLLTSKFLPQSNFVNKYNSPTDMGINTIGSCILDDEIVSIAALKEIDRRKEAYIELAKKKIGLNSWVKVCEGLYSQALKYMKRKKYDISREL